MLYKEKETKHLDTELFKNPTAAYRATPFWSWNCKLEKDELLRQIEGLKEMGFGGFHMHSRSGMGTKYLGEEFMDDVSACVSKAKEENMLAWLYDEDRWPSGFAGGYVTKKIKNRQKYIVFTVTKQDSGTLEECLSTAKPYLVACYDIELNTDGTLKKYTKIGEQDNAKGRKWYVYLRISEPRGWYNNQAYVDMMSADAIKEFIEITYEGYRKKEGEEFGKTIPAIFTDEPQLYIKHTKEFSEDLSDVSMPWTEDFPDTFKEEYGRDILESLPELVWEKADNMPSKTRWQYHDHICERFAKAFSDQCGKWCEKNGILLTGHLMFEPTLGSQSAALGETMRLYRGFQLPGIDMLCNYIELSTAKQAQSASHQFGREGVLSELYGVTGWDFDFRGHKFQGDWQAALGVTVRVPHLSWVTMKGVAKRDYPASINYQSPWYKEYSYVEDHFARLNTVLTRGKPVVRVGVIHPIESFWLISGVSDLTAALRADMEDNFTKIIERLLFGTIDFDFISEALMPQQYTPSNDKTLTIGEMSYDAIVVPAMRTIRSSTLKILNEFKNRGGKLIFIGDCPDCVDAEISDKVRELYEKSLKFDSASARFLAALENERFVSIYNSNDAQIDSIYFFNDSGTPTDDLITNIRKDGDDIYLFTAHGKKDPNPDISKKRQIQYVIKGEYGVEVLDTLNAEIYPVECEYKNGNTYFKHILYNSDSLLLRLTGTKNEGVYAKENKKPDSTIDFKSTIEFKREEPNVVLLDMAEYSLDGKTYFPKEEILRTDIKVREIIQIPDECGAAAQPWTSVEEPIRNYVYLKFTFQSEFNAECELAFEEAEEVILNGKQVQITRDDWYVDRKIYTMPLPKLKTGTNELIIKAPIGNRTDLEAYMILGDFDVSVSGCDIIISPSRKKLSFGDITKQGMPFYGGNLIYKTVIETPECDIKLHAGRYRGALLKVYVDGKDIGRCAFAPYEVTAENLAAGEHTIEIKMFGTRVNTFGGLHNCDACDDWIGPSYWYTKGDRWCYEYNLKETGILSSPVIEIYNK